jgi:hypothetical protein
MAGLETEIELLLSHLAVTILAAGNIWREKET